jgi:hypothetical protein
MITDTELAAAIAERKHWAPTGPGSAVYAAPGAPVSVRVARVHLQTRREEFMGSVIGSSGVAMFTMPFYDARAAVAWAEKVRPSAGREALPET